MCGEFFSPKRSDAEFCSPKCVAEHYRVNPNPEPIHAENHDMYRYFCEHCTNPFEVNGYAHRGGQRRPKYCSTRCKQAAYNARKEQPQQQAKRRNEKKQQSGSGNQQSNQNRQRAKSARFETRDPYAILGVKQGCQTWEIRQAYLRLAKENHPDMHTMLEKDFYTAKMQDINWAYEKLKTR